MYSKKFVLVFIYIWAVFVQPSVMGNTKPNIVLIVADDLGWNDVGFHGSTQIPTPNIDALAYAGVILNNYYVQPICTLMTGVHPIHSGLQHEVIYGFHPYGLPLSFKTLPEFLNEKGYVSRAVGKWHLGHFRKEYTPTYRGFDSFYGYWVGHLDYYSRMGMEAPNYFGYDFRENMSIRHDTYGKYATDLFTDESVRIIKKHNTSSPLFLYLAHLAVHSANGYEPLQAPKDVVEKFSHIKDKARRIFAGMMWKLDESVGKVVKALQDRNMLENSIIIFTTDNGGAAGGFNANAASNWPLRGVKAGLWEGGIRGASFVWSPQIRYPGRVSNDMMQIFDWVPTIYSAIGENTKNLPVMDGLDMWPTISFKARSPRTLMLHNIDPITNSVALRLEDWKLLYHPNYYGPQWDGWFGPSGRYNQTSSAMRFTDVKKSTAGQIVSSIMPEIYKDVEKISKAAEVLCDPLPENATKHCLDPSKPCLFNIASDPCEYFDVSEAYPKKVKLLQEILQTFNETAVEPVNEPADERSNPKYWNYVWTNWKDFE